MSIFNIGRPAPAPSTQSGDASWWGWNPYRPQPAAPSLAAAQPGRWWSWNPYRRSSRHVEAEGRRAGYERGVRDEHRVMRRRVRSRRHPVFAFVVGIAAVCGIGFLGLAYETGSFTAGGAAVDQKLREWRADLAGAADRGGHAVQDAGRSISSRGKQLSQTGG